MDFTCNNCGQNYNISSEHFGLEFECSECNTNLQVPVELPAKEPKPTPQKQPYQAAKATTDERCPKCHAVLKPNAKICIECGHNLQLGMNVRTVEKAKKAGSMTTRIIIVILVGLIGAVIGGLFWGWLWKIAAGISLPTMLLAAVSVGIGGAIGFGVKLGIGNEGKPAAAIAVVFTIIAVFVGNITYLHIGLADIYAESMQEDSELLAEVTITSFPNVTHCFTEAELTAIAEELEKHDDLNESLIGFVKPIVEAKPKEIKQEIASIAVKEYIGEMTLYEKIESNFAVVDLIFLIVGCVFAWRIGSGNLLSNSSGSFGSN